MHEDAQRCIVDILTKMDGAEYSEIADAILAKLPGDVLAPNPSHGVLCAEIVRNQMYIKTLERKVYVQSLSMASTCCICGGMFVPSAKGQRRCFNC